MSVLHRVVACSIHALCAFALIGGGCSFPDPRIGEVQCERDSDCDFLVEGKPCERAVCSGDRLCGVERRDDDTACDAGVCFEGVCVGCFDERHCAEDGTEICLDHGCVPSHCDDGDINGGETDLNCGGPNCPACPASGACLEDGDCLSGSCHDEDFTCVACDSQICNGDFYCEEEACVPRLADGLDCASPAQCLSNYCHPDSGKCCDQACNGPCMACDGASTGASDGTCAPVRAGIDPYDDCGGILFGNCDGKGACQGIQL